MGTTSYEKWSAGDSYENFMGKWSSDVAIRFIEWLGIKPSRYWLDIGCGTGALTRSIVSTAHAKLIIGVDPSLSFTQFATEQTKQATFVVAGGIELPLTKNTFDVVVSGLALNFISHPLNALLDMRRVAKSDGIIAAYVWDYADKMEFLRYFWDSAVELNPDAMKFHEGQRFPLCHPHNLYAMWEQAGFKDIVVEAIDIPTIFDTFEEYWEPFMIGNFPAPNYLKKLNPIQQDKFKQHIRKTLPIEADGSIHLIGRVWAIRGHC